MELFEAGLKRCKLEYADIWRLMALERGGMHSQADVDAMIEALDTARKKGLCRFTGFSTHDRKWAKMLIEKYPDVMQVLCTPYTAKSKELPAGQPVRRGQEARRGHAGHQAVCQQRDLPGRRLARRPASSRRTTARPAWRSATSSAIPAITAPIPGLISPAQVDNMVAAVRERRELDEEERAELEQLGNEMWADCRPTTSG